MVEAQFLSHVDLGLPNLSQAWLHLCACVTLGQLICLSEPEFLIHKMRIMTTLLSKVR